MIILVITLLSYSGRPQPPLFLSLLIFVDVEFNLELLVCQFLWGGANFINLWGLFTRGGDYDNKHNNDTLCIYIYIYILTYN